MSHGFDAKTGLILVEAEVAGPAGKAGAGLVLDTGATSTSLNVNLLRSVGYDPDSAVDFVRMATGTAVVTVPRLTINRLSAFSQHAVGLRALAHNLPVEAAVDLPFRTSGANYLGIHNSLTCKDLRTAVHHECLSTEYA